MGAAYERLVSGATPYASASATRLRYDRHHLFFPSRFVEFMGVRRREFEHTWAHVLRSVWCCKRVPRRSVGLL